MNIELIERDIRELERSLQNCRSSVLFLKQENEKSNADSIYTLSQEIFFLEDKLFRCNISLNLLKEEQEPSYEIPKRI